MRRRSPAARPVATSPSSTSWWVAACAARTMPRWTWTSARRSPSGRTSIRASIRPRKISFEIRSRTVPSLARSSSPTRSWTSRNRWLTAFRLTDTAWRAFSPAASPYPVMLRIAASLLSSSLPRPPLRLRLRRVQPAFQLVRGCRGIAPALHPERFSIDEVRGGERKRDDEAVPGPQSPAAGGGEGHRPDRPAGRRGSQDHPRLHHPHRPARTVRREGDVVPLLRLAQERAHPHRPAAAARAAARIDPQARHRAGDQLAVPALAHQDRDAAAAVGVWHQEEMTVPEGEDEALAAPLLLPQRGIAVVAQPDGRAQVVV